MLRHLVVMVLVFGFFAAVAWGNLAMVSTIEDWCERRFGGRD